MIGAVICAIAFLVASGGLSDLREKPAGTSA